ncbi:DASH complex subunit Dad4 [Pilobolus umbonatus]|nr:DASH complex subunit Dad4 [Pilobolus umbonatus]
MENPHEQQQNVLLCRIVANVSKLNDSISSLNQKMKTINRDNEDTVGIAHMWAAYNDSVRIHIENNKKQ